MEQRIYHGSIAPDDFANVLIAHFHRGNYQVQKIGSGERIAVQIASSPYASSGGATAVGISLQKVADGVAVEVGKQAWAGIAASLGKTALDAIINPFSLLTRLDDLAQDVESIQLCEEVWKVIDRTARSLGSGFELSERLKRVVCEYCSVPNPVDVGTCLACGAPLGMVQPVTCRRCGYVMKAKEHQCPNCGARLNDVFR